MSPLDLHVLGTPPAFVLSQDQTLPFNPSSLSLHPSDLSHRCSFSDRLPSSAELFWNLRCLLPFEWPSGHPIARFFSVSFSRFDPLPLAVPRSSQPEQNIKNPPRCQALFSNFLNFFCLAFGTLSLNLTILLYH